MKPFRYRQTGGALPKYILLLLFMALLVGFFWWKGQHGVTGTVRPIVGTTSDAIAMIRRDGQQTSIVLVQADGSGETTLLSDDRNKLSICWSPDGKALCYTAEVAEERGRANQLFIHDARGSNQITQGSVSKDSPQWRPTGNQIGFLAGGTVKVIGTNGEDMEQIYPPPHKGGGETGGDQAQEQDESGKKPPIDSFRWSPDGSAIAGVQITEGEQAVAVGQGRWWDKPSGQGGDAPSIAEPETLVLLPGLTEKPQVLVNTNSTEVYFDWLPDSKRMVVALNQRGKDRGIGLFRADETRITPLGLLGASGYTIAPKSVSVSPDGSQVAFEVYRLSSAEDSSLMGIAVISTDPARFVQVAKPEEIEKLKFVVKGDAKGPKWSLDGTRLLYSMPNEAKTGNDVWVVNQDGSKPVNLTKGRGDNFAPTWSPSRK